MLEQQLAVGGTYRFTFKPEFVRHGVCSGDQTCLHASGGVFRVQQICTYTEIILANINLYANFFEPLGYSQEEYEAYYQGKPEDRYTPEYTDQKVKTEYWETKTTYDDNGVATTGQVKVTGTKYNLVETGKSVRTKKYLEELSYGYNPIYKLIDVSNPDDILYAPEKTILGVPEVGVKEYQDMTLAIDVGFWDNPEKLDGLIMNVRERLAAYGIIPKSVSAFSADSKWMTPGEYDAAVESREKNKGTIVDLTPDNVNRYDGNSVLVDGLFKTLVNDFKSDGSIDPTVTATSNQVKASSLAIMDTLLDNKLFLAPCSDTNFLVDKQYFWKIGTNTYIKLSVGDDYGVGDPVIRRIPYDEGNATGKTRYRDDGSVYAPIYSIAMAQEALGEGVKLFTREDRTVSGVTTPIYTAYTDTSISDDSTEVFWYMVSKHTWVADDQGTWMSADPTSYQLYALDYTREEGLSQLAKRFTYTTQYNTSVTVELSATQLVSLAGDVEVKRLRIDKSVVANRYSGRWFEYEDVDSDGNKYTFVVLVNGPVQSSITSGFYPVGRILGTQGKAWSRCFLTTGTMEKSYFKKYHDELAENQRLAAKVAALEQIVLAYNKNSTNT